MKIDEVKAAGYSVVETKVNHVMYVETLHKYKATIDCNAAATEAAKYAAKYAADATDVFIHVRDIERMMRTVISDDDDDSVIILGIMLENPGWVNRILRTGDVTVAFRYRPAGSYTDIVTDKSYTAVNDTFEIRILDISGKAKQLVLKGIKQMKPEYEKQLFSFTF